MSNQSENPNPTSSSTKITLKTSDNELFEVEEAVAMKFCTVKQYFDDENNNNVTSGASTTVIPLPNVESHPLSILITYCKKHLKIKANNADNKKEMEKEMEQCEQELLRKVMPQELTELILAANYLNFKEALDFFCRAVASAIQNKSVEYVRKFFGLESDFEPGEEEKLREEFAWSFEGVDEG
ncbi:hypothetical protein SO802_010869 [Lithocarpus litseifolius]|uniref:SKP1-like protein n=1 Tax=Lithocarpus litseifolius TaxID=425828 RepID=A0AAW2DFE6_9ROSI